MLVRNFKVVYRNDSVNLFGIKRGPVPGLLPSWISNATLTESISHDVIHHVGDSYSLAGNEIAATAVYYMLEKAMGAWKDRDNDFSWLLGTILVEANKNGEALISAPTMHDFINDEEKNMFCKITAKGVSDMGNLDGIPLLEEKNQATLANIIEGWFSYGLANARSVYKDCNPFDIYHTQEILDMTSRGFLRLIRDHGITEEFDVVVEVDFENRAAKISPQAEALKHLSYQSGTWGGDTNWEADIEPVAQPVINPPSGKRPRKSYFRIYEGENSIAV